MVEKNIKYEEAVNKRYYMEFNQYENKIFYNADDEFPDCLKCNYADWCNGEQCGPENGWARYFRSVDIEKVVENDLGKD